MCVFLPILEGSPGVVRCKMIDGLKVYGLSEWVLDFLPFEKVVIEGLGSQSEYWSGLVWR